MSIHDLASVSPFREKLQPHAKARMFSSPCPFLAIGGICVPSLAYHYHSVIEFISQFEKSSILFIQKPPDLNTYQRLSSFPFVFFMPLWFSFDLCECYNNLA